MKFLFIIAHDHTFSPTHELTQRIISWNAEMNEKGYLIDSNPLVPAEEGITIRIRNNQIEKSDGPFSECNEQIAAYVLIECNSIEEAIEIAEKHPMAKAATIEVRRIWDDLALEF